MNVRRFSWLLLLACALAACSDDDVAGPDPDATAGLYILQTINGQPLPFRLINVANALILDQLGGTMRLNEDNTFVERDSLRWTINDEQGVPQISDTTVVFTGIWIRTDSLMELTDQNGDLLIGVISGRNLTLNLVLDSIVTFVYRK